MKLPKKLNKESLKIEDIAHELMELDNPNFKEIEKTTKWLQRNDVFIFQLDDKEFKSWTQNDYSNNMSLNDGSGQPYTFFTNNYAIMHDYC